MQCFEQRKKTLVVNTHVVSRENSRKHFLGTTLTIVPFLTKPVARWMITWRQRNRNVRPVLGMHPSVIPKLNTEVSLPLLSSLWPDIADCTRAFICRRTAAILKHGSGLIYHYPIKRGWETYFMPHAKTLLSWDDRFFFRRNISQPNAVHSTYLRWPWHTGHRGLMTGFLCGIVQTVSFPCSCNESLVTRSLGFFFLFGQEDTITFSRLQLSALAEDENAWVDNLFLESSLWRLGRRGGKQVHLKGVSVFGTHTWREEFMMSNLMETTVKLSMSVFVQDSVLYWIQSRLIGHQYCIPFGKKL